MNAAHHFLDLRSFVSEARRVLRSGGSIGVIGLDPSQGTDRWFIYDYFEGTRSTDEDRYPTAALLRELLIGAGFSEATTRPSCELVHRETASAFLARGHTAKSSTSQLALLEDEAFESGRRRLIREAADHRERGQELWLTAELTLFGTFAHV